MEWSRRIQETFWRLAASGLVPRRWALGDLPSLPRSAPALAPPDRPLKIEIVSHCWRYQHLLGYQLSSLVLYPPERCRVTMTVFHAAEDEGTVEALEFFGRQAAPNVTWNWAPLSRQELFRRAIGRNRAALETKADWVWFSDCDVIFHRGALDTAAELLRGRDDLLCFPREHGVTDLLEADHPLLQEGSDSVGLIEIDPESFTSETRQKAVGGFQILRGDAARDLGYCNPVPFYQKPVSSWQKTYEDRTFRWILGTHGTPLDIPGLYRIRHLVKGRKTG
ncbi:MAG: glycosyltransferase family 2 protein [Gemmatimonadales bacterium]|nr:MAG: glycosyltransferase family 2 protein [Gemmatimonadales bacterium]